MDPITLIVNEEPTVLTPTVDTPATTILTGVPGPPGEPGPTGPQGPKGDSGDVFFMYEQDVAAATWDITHNLNKYPSVTVVDSAGSVVIGAVQFLDLNSVELSFGAAFTGRAYFN